VLPHTVDLGEGGGITTAIVVAAFGAICLAGVLVALWAALRRPLDERVESLLWLLGDQLDEIAEQVTAASRREGEYDAGLGDAIGSTIELGDVLLRTLVAAEALPAVDGSQVWVRRPTGTVTTAARGLVAEGDQAPLAGPPDGAPYLSGLVSWDVAGPEALRTGLVVPLGPDHSGSLAVYSRLPNAFDSEAAHLLAAIARRAETAVQNAYRFLEAQERAATDARTGLGSASAFEEALPREISGARRHGRPLCLIQIDLDDFGSINKTHPRHLAAGDDVLAEFGERVRSTIRGSDLAFRNSGGADEFFLILPETTREYAELLYSRLDFELAAAPFGDVGAVTMSSGLAELRPDDTPESLRRRAGEAMVVAKNSGKNQLLTDADA
jgi:diguanylate cyclase (GGDEF)-like protein